MLIRREIPANEIRLVVFDLDGTLIDSRLDLSAAVNAMLRQLGRAELPCDLIASYVGDGAPMLVRRALGDPDDEGEVRQALQLFLAYYREHKLDHTYVYPGILEALHAIQSGSAGRRHMALLTNKPVHPARQIVEALGLAPFFERVYGGDSFRTKKPDPLGARQILQEFDAAPGQALIVGDSDVDVLTGKNAGLWTCGVAYGFAPASLATVTPDVHLSEPGELALLLSGSEPLPMREAAARTRTETGEPST